MFLKFQLNGRHIMQMLKFIPVYCIYLKVSFLIYLHSPSVCNGPVSLRKVQSALTGLREKQGACLQRKVSSRAYKILIWGGYILMSMHVTKEAEPDLNGLLNHTFFSSKQPTKTLTGSQKLHLVETPDAQALTFSLLYPF